MRRLLAFLIFCIAAALLSQNVAFSLHQGKHVSQSVQKNSTQGPSWDDESCPTCDAARTQGYAASPFVSPSLERTVETISFAPPVDPKTRILRTCEARGPPSVLS